MAEIFIKYNSIESLGYVSCNVPSDILLTVGDEVQYILDTDFQYASPFNYALAGSLEKEYSLNKCVGLLNKFFEKVIPQYWLLNNNIEESKKRYVLSYDKNYNQTDIWVNFQKRYEYNPIHNHAGVLSFVMYIQIPYNLNEERQHSSVINSNMDNSTSFKFIYPGLNPNTTAVCEHRIDIDKNTVGTMIIFPSWLQHMVTPFYTSTEYRISVAGNLNPE